MSTTVSEIISKALCQVSGFLGWEPLRLDSGGVPGARKKSSFARPDSREPALSPSKGAAVPTSVSPQNEPPPKALGCPRQLIADPTEIFFSHETTGEAFGFPRMISCCRLRLERNPRTELDLPHQTVGLQSFDEAAICAVNATIGIAINGMIEHIEEF